MDFKGFLRLIDRWKAFHDLPFPTEWARNVDGIGLASLSLEADKWFEQLMNHIVPGGIVVGLQSVVEKCELVLPALSGEALAYFREVHFIAIESLTFLRRIRPAEFSQ